MTYRSLALEEAQQIAAALGHGAGTLDGIAHSHERLGLTTKELERIGEVVNEMMEAVLLLTMVGMKGPVN